ncbi:hypothetical protein SCALM49S_10291 [Streptomyces californicus]
MTTPAEPLRSFLRTRASLDGAEVTYWWSGDVYSWAPDEPYQRLFGFEGLNVSRLVEDAEAGPDAYRLLTREAAFYLDPVSPGDPGELAGPARRTRLERPGQPEAASRPDPHDRAGRAGLLSSGDPARLPLAAAGGRVPGALGGDTYKALELFQFFADRADLAGPAPASRRPCRGAGCRRGSRGWPGGSGPAGSPSTAGPQADRVHRGTRPHPGVHRRPPPGVRARPGAVERTERDELDVLPQARPAPGVAPQK